MSGLTVITEHELDEQYTALLRHARGPGAGPPYSAREIAMYLARFAEARMKLAAEQAPPKETQLDRIEAKLNALQPERIDPAILDAIYRLVKPGSDGKFIDRFTVLRWVTERMRQGKAEAEGRR